MSYVLVINSGSSSFKYQLISPDTEDVHASGLVEKIGSDAGFSTHFCAEGTFEQQVAIPNYERGIELMLAAFAAHGPRLDAASLTAVGHRIVQGGARYFGPVIIDDKVEQDIDELSALAPLHNPAALVSIRAARALFPTVPHVAVFDTAFHQTMQPAAYRYAIDPEVAAKHRIRKYGFHGTSHSFVAEATAKFLGRDIAELNLITLHLGNGASATAIAGGKAVDTSMGMTPLEGLVMGTRSGDIDPAVLFHLAREADYSISDLDTLLNRRSGLFGMTGSADMRDVQHRAANGDAVAAEALEVYYHRVRHYLGGYFANLGRVDAIVFTAGVGENSVETRAGIIRNLEQLGIELDAERNRAAGRAARIISTDNSRVKVLVVPTNEELAIAQLAVVTVAGRATE